MKREAGGILIRREVKKKCREIEDEKNEKGNRGGERGTDHQERSERKEAKEKNRRRNDLKIMQMKMRGISRERRSKIIRRKYIRITIK